MTMYTSKKSNGARRNFPPEPLAIVGIGCRFPGKGDSPEAFWTLLQEGVDTFSEVPADRWDTRRFNDTQQNVPGTAVNFEGGFLSESIESFDAEFFGISPREAAVIDPQQRLLMEVAWEALEDAGVPADELCGTPVGVYVGGFTTDSLLAQLSLHNRDAINSHSATSATLGMLANRISYLFDFRGPSITIDTACSSSLVALNYACRDLWQGECSVALAAGVNIMMRPEFPIAMTKGNFLSADSRSKAFDARANGYARGEGGGVVVLKRLSEAQANGDRIYATIRGIGVNQDGRTSGITVPNPEAQEHLISRIYRDFDIDPADVSFVEAHGTGTPVGDPIEMQALGKALGGTPERLVGSVKANIGHQEAAAGIAATIKAAMVLRKGKVPPQINFETPNPNIPFKDLGLRIPTKLEDLPKRDNPACVSINSFGFGGTNAHAVLSELPAQANGVTPSSVGALDWPLLLPVSARSPVALASLAHNYADQFGNAGSDDLFVKLARAMALRRSHSQHRLAIVARNADEVAQRLLTFAEAQSGDGILAGRAPAKGARDVTFVFTGMGPQWWAMGRELLDWNVAFRDAVTEADAAFAAHSGWSILDEMLADEPASRIASNEIAQPANFILQVGLFALWKSWGITPSAIIGHSVGEVAAAYAAGTLTLNEAALVSYHRSRCQQKVAGQGGMLAVALSAEEAEDIVALYPGRVSLAAINSASSIALAGEIEALTEIADMLTDEAIFNRMLKVEVAYHSHQMDPLEAELLDSLKTLQPKTPAIPLWSTVSANQVTTVLHDAEYWWQNVRQPVRFADALLDMAKSELDLFVEVGPHPVLAPAIKETIAKTGGQADVLNSLRRGATEPLTITEALGGLYCAGADVDWTVLYGDTCEHQDLPLYPWQREKYWQETDLGRAYRLGGTEDALLGQRQSSPEPVWQSELTHTSAAFLQDHVVDNAIVFPGAGYAQIMLAAQKDLSAGKGGVIENVAFLNALVFDADDKPLVRTQITDDATRIAIHGRRAGAETGWLHCAEASLSQAHPRATPDHIDLTGLKHTFTEALPIDALYAMLDARGLSYGPCFRGLEALHRDKNRFLGKIRLDPSITLSDDYSFIHPTMLDAAFQALIAGLDQDSDLFDAEAVFVPVAIKRLSLVAPVGTSVWCYGKADQNSATAIEGEITLCDDTGKVLALVEGFRCQVVPRAASAVGDPLDNAFYRYDWREVARSEGSGAEGENWLVVAQDTAVAKDVVAGLRASGATSTVLVPGANFSSDPDGTVTLDLENPEHWAQLNAATFGSVVYFGQRNKDLAATDPAGVSICTGLLGLVQNLVRQGTETRLNIVTTGGGAPVLGDEYVGSADQFALTGLARVIANEHPELNCRLIDLGVGQGAGTSADLINTLLAEDGAEDEIALRASARYVHRLGRQEISEAQQSAEDQPASAPFELDVAIPGEISSSRFVATERRAPEPDEVELKILAVSLNFKDILKIMGVLSDEIVQGTFFGHDIGMEAAVEVLSAGSNVIKYKAGDRLVATLPNGSFKSYATVAASDVHGVPELAGYSLLDLAGMPIAFVTALYGLKRIANTQPGERVLLHSAAGGVGLAAIQVANLLGAEVYATAGSDEKRDHLRSLGVKHVFDSRSLDFADDIRRATDGAGVDVVLNFLPGEAQEKSLSLLAPFGRFIEIGKRDIDENRGLGLGQFNRNLQFTAIDVDRMLAEKPALFDEMLQEVWDHLGKGAFRPVPATLFPISEFTEACHTMRRATHIGKIVVRIEDERLPIIPAAEKLDLCRPDGSYLITGGFGGFGLKLAEWLADQGAGTLVLVGRSGATSDEAKATVKSLEARGVTVLSVSADISDLKAVKDLFVKIATSAPALRGIYHAAAVLDDGVLSDMNAERFSRVMAAKATGGWHLHEASLETNLDHFVLFSSVSALVGNPGQGNYAAANTFLDGLAHLRAAQGLPAVSVNWGALSQVGMAARDAKVEERLNQIGVGSITPVTALTALGRLLRQGIVQVGVMNVDWARWRQTNPVAGTSPKFEDLIAVTDAGENASSALMVELAQMDASAQVTHITGLLSHDIAEVLRLPVDRLDVTQPLSDMGIDSLMMVDVQLAIERSTGVEVTVMELSRGGSVARLALDLLSRLTGGADAAEIAPQPAAPEITIEDTVDELSNDEVERMLLELAGEQDVMAK